MQARPEEATWKVLMKSAMPDETPGCSRACCRKRASSSTWTIAREATTPLPAKAYAAGCSTPSLFTIQMFLNV
jgi:hypothetical protein